MLHSLLKKFKSKTYLHDVFMSGGWLFFDKIFRLFLGLFVGILLARYLDPKNFGLLNYAMAYVAIFSVIANLGLDNIVVRDLSENSSREPLIVGTAWILKFIGAMISIVFCLFAIIFLDSTSNPLLVSIIFILSLSSIFQTTDVIDFVYQVRMKAKLSAFARGSAFLLSSSFKLILIYISADLTTFAYASLLESAIAASLFVGTYVVIGGKITRWEFSKAEAIRLLKEGWPLLFSGILVVLYIKIDQIMIGAMLDGAQVGIYSVAVRLTEVWYFIPVIITTVIFPTIVRLKSKSKTKYLRALEHVYVLMLWLSLTLALMLTFLSEYVVQILFGISYIDAASVVKIQCWSGIFIFSGLVSNQWYLLEGKSKYIFYRNVLGVCINVALNIILIPRFGINGSAAATLITQIIISYLFDAFSTTSRELFYLRTRVFIFFIPMTYRIIFKNRA